MAVTIQECFHCGGLYDRNVGCFISRQDAAASYGADFQTERKYFSQECFLAHTGLSEGDATRVMPAGLPQSHAKL